MNSVTYIKTTKGTTGIVPCFFSRYCNIWWCCPAGGGKTFALLLEVLRHINNADFGAVFFRREMTQITSEGGLFDMALKMYLPMGANARQSPFPQITFPSGARVTFRHLQLEKDIYSYQGTQIPLIVFDELCHFSMKQFFYMLSRNRSVCGVKPYIRATCNPDSDSWVADFLSWWIDQDTGYPIPERDAKIRYFLRVDGAIEWGDTREELAEKFNESPSMCKSVTFIHSSVYDNKELLKVNPEYISALNALPLVEKERLLKGNWKIRASAGLYFKKEQARIVKTIPDKIVDIARAYDLAATEITIDNKNPDRTAGVLMARLKNGAYIIIDVIRGAFNASTVRKLIKSTAVADKANYGNVKITIPQDPGQAGLAQAQSYIKELAGFNIKSKPVSGSKINRAEPFASQWQNGNVYLLEGDWNEVFLNELEGFPDVAHDDQVDAASDAFSSVANSNNYCIAPMAPEHTSYWI